MASFDCVAWRTSVERLLEPLLANFADRFGYAPGENAVIAASPESSAAASKSSGAGPEVLAEFYHHISKVSLPDVHNGLFVHPLSQVLANETNGMPVRAPRLTEEAIVVFGSDGGGSLFALGESGAPVYFLPPGAVMEGVYSGGLQEPKVLSATFAEFLDWMRSVVAVNTDSVERTVILIVAGRRTSGEPSYEELLVDRLPDGRYRVAAAPGLANGLAAKDIVAYDPDSREVAVVERGGNLCVQIYGTHRVPEEFVAGVNRLGGTFDGATERNSVYSIPVTATFPVVEKMFNEFVAAYAGTEWYFGNVYDPADDETPLNWWT